MNSDFKNRLNGMSGMAHRLQHNALDQYHKQLDSTLITFLDLLKLSLEKFPEKKLSEVLVQNPGGSMRFDSKHMDELIGYKREDENES